MTLLKEPSAQLQAQLASDIRAYRLMLKKMTLQQKMNSSEVQMLQAKERESEEQSVELQRTTAQLEQELQVAKEVQAQKKQYSDLISEFLKPHKVEVTMTRRVDVPKRAEVKDGQDGQETDGDAQESHMSSIQPSESPDHDESRRKEESDSESDSDDMDVDDDEEEEEEAEEDKMDVEKPEETSRLESYNETITAHLFRTRKEAMLLNGELQQDISDLKVTNSQYESTWQQRRHRFLELIGSLHTFQDDIQTEKADQERRAAEREEEEQKRQDEGDGDDE